MRYLLDTNVISDVMKAIFPVSQAFLKTDLYEMALSTISVQEIEFGLNNSPIARQKYEPYWREIKSKLWLLNYELEDAEETGRLMAIMLGRGQSIDLFDFQIAGVALSRGLTLVTDHSKHFDMVPGLNHINWKRS